MGGIRPASRGGEFAGNILPSMNERKKRLFLKQGLVFGRQHINLGIEHGYAPLAAMNKR